jgi:hypothetical protein
MVRSVSISLPVSQWFSQFVWLSVCESQCFYFSVCDSFTVFVSLLFIRYAFLSVCDLVNVFVSQSVGQSVCLSLSQRFFFGIPRQAEVALRVPGRLRPRIFSTFGTTRVVGRQPNAPAAFTPREIPGTHFQRQSLPQGTWFCRKEPRKNPKWHHRGSIPGPSD